ncbi:MAG: D-tyrosyl-tRNA(Tyr) deacylase [Bacteroidetes bacterium]|jgi:D-tyrosyl-tRNA(Tyr) deacylase|nr:D-tyrosyl-tRNA(Tyr) deacylase [Bacteroidota bacterium]
MRTVIQRVHQAGVTINNNEKHSIEQGLLVLVGFENDDSMEDIEWMSKKIVNLRIFDDINGIMNLSIRDKNFDILVVSQFTLHASTKKGNRPSYIKAAKPDISIPLYNQFVDQLSIDLGKPVKTGEFGANMDVELINNGPVTISIDTKNKE